MVGGCPSNSYNLTYRLKLESSSAFQADKMANHYFSGGLLYTLILKKKTVNSKYMFL